MVTSSDVPAVRTRTRWRRVWSEAWRLGVAFVVSALAAGFVIAEMETGLRAIDDEQMAVDVLVGLVGFGLVLLRHRVPTVVALLLSGAAAVSVFTAGPLVLAVVSLATHRRWWRIVAVGVPFVLGGAFYGVLYPAQDDLGVLVEVAGGVVMYAMLVWIGAYIGLRREHLAELRERAETAEREQASRVAQARANERARIAREMHDVLAHRMSLVAMHAGALAYRSDLPPEKVAETAALVRDSAHEALGELREVLGVLRGLDGPAAADDSDGADAAGATPSPVAARPEKPQPTLADLDELVRATTAGTATRVMDRLTDADRLPTATSRTAYRIVQEALTNARKHAPEMPASVVLRGAPGQGLWITVTNPTPERGGAAESDETPVPASGLGLLGLIERAELAGGTLTARESDGRFALRAWLPWAP